MNVEQEGIAMHNYRGRLRDLDQQGLTNKDVDNLDIDNIDEVELDISPEDADNVAKVRRTIEDHLEDLQFHRDFDYLDDEDFDDLDDIDDIL